MAGNVRKVAALPLLERDRLEQAWSSIVLVGRVIYAIIIRETRTRYGQSEIGYAWAIIDPLVELSVLVALFTAFGRVSPIPVTLPVFLTSGIVPYSFFKNCMSRGASAASANAALLTYPQVKISDVVLGRVILEFVTTACVYVFFIFVLRFLDNEPLTSWQDAPLPMFLAVAGVFYVGLCAAFFSSSMTRLTPVWANIWSYMSRPLWFLSGIFYSLSALPSGPRKYMTYNPLAHLLEWFRSDTLGAFQSDHYSPVYVIVFFTIALGIGLAIDRMLTLVGHTESDH